MGCPVHGKEPSQLRKEVPGPRPGPGEVRAVEQQHVAEELPVYLNGTLDAPARARVEAHLASCPSCREELAFWRELSGLVQEELQSMEKEAPAPTVAPPLTVPGPACEQVRSGRGLADRGGLPAGPRRILRRIWTLLTGQLAVLRPRILLASLSVLAAGMLALVPSGLPDGAVVLFRGLAPSRV